MDAKNLFKGITTLLKVDDVCIDNVVFRLHYKATVMVLLAFALVVTSKEYIGDPIECHVYGKEVKMINAYCWIFSTHTVTDENDVPGRKKDPGLPHHHGVKTMHSILNSPDQYDSSVMYHNYYQWVGFFLLIQAVLFYIPFYLWHLWEGGRLRCLVSTVAKPVVEMADGDGISMSVAAVVQGHLLYWENHRRYHGCYAFRYAFCELLNMVNVVAQFYILDVFLGGKFMNYGSTFFGRSEVAASEMIERVFPKLAKCSYTHYGPTGDKVNVDALCVLSLNVVNAKVFAIQWLWFMILAFLSGATLVYRMACYMCHKLRMALLRSCCRSVSRCRLKALLRILSYGDWFFLYQMAKNMNPLVFTKLIYELSEKFGHQEV